MSDTKHSDGGPAFPGLLAEYAQDRATGMSLLDYFAGQALTGLLAGGFGDENGPLSTVYEAYIVAAAMLSEKERRRG